MFVVTSSQKYCLRLIGVDFDPLDTVIHGRYIDGTEFLLELKTGREFRAEFSIEGFFKGCPYVIETPFK